MNIEGKAVISPAFYMVDRGLLRCGGRGLLQFLLPALLALGKPEEMGDIVKRGRKFVGLGLAVGHALHQGAAPGEGLDELDIFLQSRRAPPGCRRRDPGRTGPAAAVCGFEVRKMEIPKNINLF